MTFDDLEDLNEWNGNTAARGPYTAAVAALNPDAPLGGRVWVAKVARFTCDKCGGSGRFIGYTGRDLGACNKCKGGGKLKTDPAANAKRRTQAAERKAAQRAEWTEAHADVMTWLHAQREGFEFAQSMRAAVAQYGSLTDNQLAAVRRCMERSAERAAVQAAKPADAQVAGAGFERMLGAFASAKASGLKFPKFHVGELTFSLAGAASKNAGCLYVKAGETYLGRVTDQGGFFKSRDCGDEQAATVATVCADPFAAAVMHGKQTGRCSCCGRTLENEESVALGIGPICREKWGM